MGEIVIQIFQANTVWPLGALVATTHLARGAVGSFSKSCRSNTENIQASTASSNSLQQVEQTYSTYVMVTWPCASLSMAGNTENID